MNLDSQATLTQTKFHQDAYRFIYEALHHTQQKLDRIADVDSEEEAHITGQELMYGVRELASQRYGILAKNVFSHWNVRSTGDFGRIVFDMIDRGEMRKTERDQLSDFFNVFDFEDAFNHDYEISTDFEDR